MGPTDRIDTCSTAAGNRSARGGHVLDRSSTADQSVEPVRSGDPRGRRKSLPETAIGGDDEHISGQYPDQLDDGRVAVVVGPHHIEARRTDGRPRSPGDTLEHRDQPIDSYVVAVRPGDLDPRQLGQPGQQPSGRPRPVPPPTVRPRPKHVGHIDHDDHASPAGGSTTSSTSSLATVRPEVTVRERTVPSTGATRLCSIFIASTTTSR